MTALRARKIPCVLLNGRLSADSFRRWSLAKGWARKLLSGFVLGLAQTEAERARFAALGLPNAQCIGNLKYAAEPLPYDDNELHRLKAKLGTRKVWLMASTHPGEDEIALAAHQK
ncbi:MAG: 3-deoxy-D-manno-octulosonic acid transferase, partial [Alphaproteobacteria bacterium]|nr:3-deoxy-D-manno-octulosonic acid transferase [Alphaproteobacteria bacterium]